MCIGGYAPCSASFILTLFPCYASKFYSKLEEESSDKAHTEKKRQVNQLGLQIQAIFSEEFKLKKYEKIGTMSIFPTHST